MSINKGSLLDIKKRNTKKVEIRIHNETYKNVRDPSIIELEKSKA